MFYFLLKHLPYSTFDFFFNDEYLAVLKKLTTSGGQTLTLKLVYVKNTARCTY